MMDSPGPGLRERNKLRTRRRIREAAKAAFQELGFERATIRDVAARAEVALRTVFLYAADKRDLLFLVFNEDLDTLFAEAFARAPPRAELADRLVGVFASLYPFFLARLDLARAALREMVFFDPDDLASGPSRDFHVRRERVHAGLIALLSEEEARGGIRPPDRLELVASNLQAVFLVEIRLWLLSPEPQVEAGLDRLRRLFRLQIAGLSPAEPRGA